MSSSKKLADFPDVEAKLQKPNKKSVFERQREEAEAKRRREAAETAAVLEDFVKSFDRDGGDNRNRDNRPPPSRYDRPPPAFGDRPPAHGAGGGKRHFGLPSGSQSMKSGPGSLGPAPTSFGKKRPFDGFAGRSERDDGRGGRLAFDDHDAGARAISKVFDTSDDETETTAAAATATSTTADWEEEKAVSKPTVRLANLPPGTSPAVIKALIPSNLVVEGVKLLPPAGPGATERKSLAAIVTLSAETAATDIDAAVSSLQHRYLGFGFYLSIHRHLSSAAISGSLAVAQSASTTSHPFGAKAVPRSGRGHGHQHRGHGRGFAPPSSYHTSGGGPVSHAGILHVPVQPPRDIKQLRMIHMAVEAVLEHGAEFEALLMSRPDVQREAKWAWMWDARSEGGVWYRYKLWEAITGARPKRGRAKFTPVFEDSSAWKLPDQPLPYEFTTGVDEFVSDSEYNSSDEDDFDDEPHKPADAAGAGADQDDAVLSPLEKAKLVHLLARLPTSLSKLRKGDIARVAAFAITHASRGAEEIVDLIISNIERPFAYTSANPDYKPQIENKDQKSRDRGGEEKDSGDSSPRAGGGTDEKPAATTAGEPQDHSAAKLIGLYVVSDILSSSSTSGIRHAWRYRQHFESALRSRKVFEHLGMVGEKMGWGRLRVEKWKRSVGLILSHWEGWCVFPAETQALFVSSFENPPALALKKEREGDKVDDGAPKKGGKWKTVDAVAAKAPAEQTTGDVWRGPPPPLGPTETKKGAAANDEDEDLGDEPYAEYTDDEDLDLEALDEEDIDGEPLSDSGIAGLSIEDDGEEDAEMGDGDGAAAAPEPADPADPEEAPKAEVASVKRFQISAAAGRGAPKKRMRAVDMFADSDSEKE